jgi:lipid biosynthesis B12-binding/radical SAM protein
MKILLIASNIATTPYPVYPLGLSMVARALIDAGHTVKQLDYLEQEKSLSAIKAETKDFLPDIVGISIRNIDNVNLVNEQRYVEAVKDIVAALREVTKAKVVLGGAGFSIMPQEILKATQADYGIAGEGEVAMVDFCLNAAQWIYPEEKIITGGKNLTGKEICSAAYDSRIMQFYLKSGQMAGVQTKRGCSYGCIYCTYPFLEGNKLRARDAADVVQDMKNLFETHKAGYIFFTDSVFNDDEGFYLKILHEMERQKLVIPWTAFIKPSRFLDLKCVELMKATGLKAVEIGADAATDVTLKGIGKDFDFNEVRRTNDLFGAQGIACAHYYMFGGPCETQATVLKGIENIKSLNRAVSFMFMGIRILPGTGLYDLAIREKIISAQTDLLVPVYYLAPGLDKGWLETTLTEGFKHNRNCIFPPDKLESSLQFLHKMGYSGSLWEMLLAERKRKPRI